VVISWRIQKIPVTVQNLTETGPAPQEMQNLKSSVIDPEPDQELNGLRIQNY
jgi:hypothetical protein